MGLSTTIARLLTSLCLAWMFVFVLVAQTSAGKQWIATTLANAVLPLFSSTIDVKGSVPLLCLSVPILLVGTICALFLRADERSNSDRIRNRIILAEQPHHPHHDHQQRPLSLQRIEHLRHSLVESCCFPLERRRRRFFSRSVRGDVNMNRIALVCIVLPICIYTALGLHRKSLSAFSTRYEAVGAAANTFGAASLLGMSFLLVPVARHSPLLKLFQWSPAVAVRLHHWTGRVVVVGGLVHGVLHVIKWQYLQEQQLQRQQHLSLTDHIWPSATCWAFSSSTSTDYDEKTLTTTCYQQWRNLTGVLAGLGLVIISITSMNDVRRTCYKAFYASHMIAGPLVFLCVILHWNRSILYLGGGLLYYLATTLVVYWESRSTLLPQSSDEDQPGVGGVRVLTVHRIPCETSSSVCLTVEADELAIQSYCPGQYINLLAPEVSSIPHPFTINIPPRHLEQHEKDLESGRKSRTHCMQIIFRETGCFTKELGARLVNPDASVVPPRLALDGFHGPANRLQSALDHHDAVVFVAGGIGITPYLSLLHQLHDTLASFRPTCKHARTTEPCCIISPYKCKRIILHWVCRDQALIDHVREQYFEPLLQRAEANRHDADSWKQFDISIKIHCTKQKQHPRPQRPPSYTNLEDGHADEGDDSSIIKTLVTSRYNGGSSIGVPFSPSKFAAGTSSWNMPLVTSFLLIGWCGLYVTWTCYANLQQSDQVWSRSISVAILIGMLPVTAYMINLMYSSICHRDVKEKRAAEVTKSVSKGEFQHGKQETGSTAPTRSSSMSSYDEEEDVELGETCIDTLCVGDCSSHKETLLIPPPSVVGIEQRNGARPSVHDFFNAFDDHELKILDVHDDRRHAQSPALYACGPTKLLQDIRKTLKERCCLRLEQCTRGESAPLPIAYYEEAFEM